MDNVAAELREIRGSLARHDKVLARIDQRFEQIDQRFEQFDQRFDTLEQRLEQRMDRGFSELGLRFEQLQSTVQFLAEQMSNFSKDAQTVRGRVDTLEDQQRMTDFRLKLLENRSAN